MKKKQFLILIVGVLAWCSCSKTEVKPADDPATPGMAMHVTNASFSSVSSYTASKVINLNGSHDITISGKSIRGGSVPSISLSNCYNVHITQNSLGNTSDVAIYLYHCYNITVDYNYIANASTGVYVDHTSNGGMVVDNNQMLNMNGPGPRGQFVQFNTVSGSGNSISHNKCENIMGSSNPQEAINLYMSHGTSSSPIEVVGNWIKGGGPASGGGGIQLGDTGGSYEVASDNILVNPGQMGISISGGDHNSMKNNSIYSKSQYFTNVGIVVWSQGGSYITNATVSGNKVRFYNASNSQNNSYIASGDATPSGWGSNVWGANISESLLPSEIISSTAATRPLAPAGSTSSSGSTATSSGSTSSSSTGGTPWAPINIDGKSNLTLSYLTITGGNVPCIKLSNCSNIYITQCNLSNSTDVAIELDNCTNVTIEKNDIWNVAAGVVAINCPGGINVFTNQMKNMQGSLHNGAFVQFSNVRGSNNNISYNKLENILGQSNTQDAIDIAQSNGTSSSPINIYQNWIRGGGPSNSGGGIKLGDNGGSYQVASANILVNPGQYGMALTGGSHISITNNSIYGVSQYFTNVGIYVWSQGSTISRSTVSGNKVNFKNSNQVQNSEWLASGEATPSGWGTNRWGSAIGASILPATIISF